MSKIRVFELAEELQIPAEKLVEALRDLNLNISNPMSMIDTQVAGIIREVIKKQRKKRPAGDKAKAPALETPPPVVVEPPLAPVAKQEPPREQPRLEQPKQNQPRFEPRQQQPHQQQQRPLESRPDFERQNRPDQRPQHGDYRTERRDNQPSRPRTDAPPTAQSPRTGQRLPARPVAPVAVAPAKPAQDTKQAPPKHVPERHRDKRFQDPEEDIVDRKLNSPSRRNRQGRGGNQPMQQALNTSGILTIEGPMTVGEFSKLSGRPVGEIIKKLLELGVMATINQQLDLDTLEVVASVLGLTLEIKTPTPEGVEVEEADDPASLEPRHPVVTVMGHVDHGKTSLLDAIRRTNVTASEAGGITQHIGAYQVDVEDKKIVFLDTPGHEAFTQMRARGAKVTDVAILVVAADDGVMPQTVEALNHAKAAGVPIIVAINKVDKPGANVERIKQQLTEYAIVPEEWGGETIFVEVSALQRYGIDNLLTSILTVAEVMELKANPNRLAQGVVIEAQVDKGKGPVATVLVQRGSLNIGDAVVAGTAYGRVRAMVSDKGKRLKKAGPSTPLELQGLSSAPQAGDEFKVVKDERTARSLAEAAADAKKAEEQRQVQRVNLDDFFKQMQSGQTKELKLIIKGDVQGSVEALKPSVEKLSNQEVEVKVIHTGIGPVNESDVILAKASDAIIIGFNVRSDPNARRAAEQEQVDVRFYRIIYEVLDDLNAALKGMLAPVFKEVVIGQAQVRATFRVTGAGVIAGCMVTEGKITRNAGVRLVRGGVVIYEGKIGSLKRFKDDAKEVAAGYECGIGLESYDDVKEGDVIEAFVKEQVKA